MTIETGFEKVYNYQVKNAIGVTTAGVGTRLPLPQPSPTDLNAIWLAPNGANINPGTEAAPKLTIAGALLALTAGKNTIHIFRNGYVGDLEFAISGATSLPIDRNIQCEIGEIAVLYTDTAGDQLTMFARSAVSGIRFEERSGVLGAAMLVVDDTGSAAGNVWAADNCTFERKVSGAAFERILLLESSANISHEISDCSFIGPYMVALFLDAVGGNRVFNNCAFTLPPLFVDNDPEDGGNYAIAVVFDDTTGGKLATYNWSNIVAYGFDSFLRVTSSAAAAIDQVTLNIAGIDINQCDAFILKRNTNASDRFSRVELDLSRAGYAITFSEVFVGASAVSQTIEIGLTNMADQNLPALYVDEAAGSVGDSTGFQLQRIGKPVGNGTYAINSPLIGAGPPSIETDDIGPWLDNAPLLSQAWNESFTIEWDAETYALAINRMNPGSIVDVNGNTHSTDDGIRKTYTLDFGSGAVYASNNDLRKLVSALADRGSLKFLPRGGDNLFTDSITCDTVIGTDEMVVTPTLGSGNPMIARNWAGFWATIAGDDFYILSNTATTMTVIDKLGNGFPVDGTYTFKVDHILVKVNQADLSAVQAMFTDFICGGAFREGADDETSKFELQGYSIALDEVEDPEAGT